MFALVAAALIRGHAAMAAAGCVAVGGVDGIDVLADPAATEMLRGTARAQLYVHDFAWQKLTQHERQAVSRPLGALRPAWVEFGEAPDAQHYWAIHVPTWTQAGILVDQAHVNFTLDEGQPVRFKAFVDAGRAVGVKLIAPIWSPNAREWTKGPFRSAAFDVVREMAEYGGGLTLDPPPYFFLGKQPEQYRQFTEEQIRWARAAGIQSTVIISPPRVNETEFIGPMREMIERLRTADALPDNFIVENYMAAPPPGFRFVVGKETDPDSVTAAALWIANNAWRGAGECR